MGYAWGRPLAPAAIQRALRGEKPRQQDTESRRDQTWFIHAESELARQKADPDKEYRFDAGFALGRDGTIPIGIEVETDGTEVSAWRPRTRADHTQCRPRVTATGRISAELPPMDFRRLDRRRWAALNENYNDSIYFAQHFNAGDLVEIVYTDPVGARHALWVQPDDLLEMPPR
jgi:hypothetical protein